MGASANRLKPKSQGGYELGYRVHIYPTFGNRQINSITSLEIEKWLRRMETKVSAHTGRPLAPASHANVSTTDSIYTHLFKGDYAAEMQSFGAVRTGTATTAVRQLRN